MASRLARSIEGKPTSHAVAHAVPRQLQITIGDIPARTISVSQTGMTAICDSALPQGGPLTVILPGLGVRLAQLVFRSDAVGAIRFDAPLSTIEFEQILA